MAMTMLTASDNGTIATWSLGEARARRTIRDHTGPVLALSIFGDTVASAGQDGRLILNQIIGTGRLSAQLVGHEEAVLGVESPPDGRRLASCGADGTVRIWEPRGCRCLRTLNPKRGRRTRVLWTPDGTGLLHADLDGVIEILGGAGPHRTRHAHADAALQYAGSHRSGLRVRRGLRRHRGRAVPAQLGRRRQCAGPGTAGARLRTHTRPGAVMGEGGGSRRPAR